VPITVTPVVNDVDILPQSNPTVTFKDGDPTKGLESKDNWLFAEMVDETIQARGNAVIIQNDIGEDNGVQRGGHGVEFQYDVFPHMDEAVLPNYPVTFPLLDAKIPGSTPEITPWRVRHFGNPDTVQLLGDDS